MEILPQFIYFIIFFCLGTVLPGIFLTVLFMKKTELRPATEALCAVSLLSGLVFQIPLWYALRWGGLGYGAVAAVHAAVFSALAYLALRDKEGRASSGALLRSVFSVETAVFAAAAAAVAAYLTYGPIQFYHRDELFRMSLAWAVQKEIPLQNMLVWTGLAKYYHVAEFFAGSASALTGTPVETVYFRFMLPLNWVLLFFGMRGLLVQYKPGFGRYIPHAAFLLFFLSHVKMLAHFTFRQNTFALGLTVLAMSGLWTAFSSGSLFPLLVCCAAPALITLSKAPFGALFLVFLTLFAVLGAREGLFTKRRAAAAVLLGAVAWYAAYRSLAGHGFQGAVSLFEISSRPGWLREFLPEYILHPGLLAALGARPGHLGGLLVFGLQTLENALTVLVSGILPLTAAACWFYFSVERGRAAKTVILSAAGVFITGTILFCFVHYRISNGGDSYWLFFSAWMLGAAAYPVFLAELEPRSLPRLAALCSVVPFILLSAAIAGRTGTAGPAVLIPIAAASTALFLLYRGSGTESGPAEKWPLSAPATFLAGLAFFVFWVYNGGGATGSYWWFLGAWILSAAAYPLFLAELRPRTFFRRAALLAIIPFLVGISHAPKHFYWAAEWKNWNIEGWTKSNQEACSVLNSRPGENKIYLHNILDRYCLTMAAMCRGRMYVNYFSGDAVWEDKNIYSSAKAEADRFFNGEIDRPCAWLAERGIGYIYWDATGSVYKFPALVKDMGFLSKIYQGGTVSLYAVGACGADSKGKSGL